MSYKAISRFVELQQALEEMGSERNIQRGLFPSATLSALQAKQELMKSAPVGKEEPSYVIERPTGESIVVSHGRPSYRLFGTTLAESWSNPVVEETRAGQRFTLSSMAPHMRFLIDGTRAHDIPKRVPGPMSYWSFRRGEPFISHWFRAFVAEHGGTVASNFVEQALVGGLEEKIGTNLLSGLRRVMGPLNSFFRKS